MHPGDKIINYIKNRNDKINTTLRESRGDPPGKS